MVLYQCKDPYVITVKNEDGSLLWNFNHFPCSFVGDRQGEAYTGTIPFEFKPDNIPLEVANARLFSVFGFDDPAWRGVPLDIHLCFAADQGRQSIRLIPNKAANFEVIEDSEYCNIIRHVYNSSSYFEIFLGSTEKVKYTDTIWLSIMNVYPD
jgi:cag pathogenicity island protein 6